MFDKETYGKILVPMVTPFQDDQRVDYDAAVSIAEKLVGENKADSLILSGTTGEFHTMTFQERVDLFKVIKEAVGDKIPVIAGVGAASTIETIQLLKKAEELGYALVMIVAPYYAKPNQAELYTHFKMAAEATSLQIMLYNIPIFTGVNIDPDTVTRLAEIENIVGIKEEAELNPKQITAFVNATPEEFIVYCGDDTMIIEAFAQGGGKRVGGVVSGGSHLIGGYIRDMIDTFLRGDVQQAADMQQRILPLFRILGQNNRTNPVALLKEAMKMVGYNAGIPRLPLSPGTPEEIANVRTVMERLSIL
ncbi:4-hydroxy-tetrahydrodipicolinate synthase [candidate division KSB3 bacterium]|uniref:4-hydroxy-tetrahydrodipicolinate synthase n=1 Tax=candidate division KSB3 bacterium TaxID=2044937 RepID=A0A9D5JUF6_9BACT|nr:4-hydroxy-tetrahydrodipicolinate synthase [candidate division KSB3 bacterium]MBD3324458.1 4-hydroxy-tetrahydrodipicolinate synthase [candidate division KSB3 bacterium]